MLRNLLAIIGAVALAGYFKPVLVARVPFLNNVPLPQVTLNGKDSPNQNNPNNPNPQTSPSPSPTPQGKRWGIHFEMKSNIGDQTNDK